MLKRPTVTDASGKTYNTAVSFVDVGAALPSFPARSRSGAGRNRAGSRCKVDAATLDLTSADTKTLILSSTCPHRPTCYRHVGR
jgi:hypothetical protein